MDGAVVRRAGTICGAAVACAALRRAGGNPRGKRTSAASAVAASASDIQPRRAGRARSLLRPSRSRPPHPTQPVVPESNQLAQPRQMLRGLQCVFAGADRCDQAR